MQRKEVCRLQRLIKGHNFDSHSGCFGLRSIWIICNDAESKTLGSSCYFTSNLFINNQTIKSLRDSVAWPRDCCRASCSAWLAFILMREAFSVLQLLLCFISDFLYVRLTSMQNVFSAPGEVYVSAGSGRSTLPKPMMANVLPTIETPTNFVLSHFPALTEASAWATFLLRAAISAIPCSAAAIVLAVGAFTTRQPHCKNILISCHPLYLYRNAEAALNEPHTLRREMRSSNCMVCKLLCQYRDEAIQQGQLSQSQA